MSGGVAVYEVPTALLAFGTGRIADSEKRTFDGPINRLSGFDEPNTPNRLSKYAKPQLK